jgi:hypothetical protein
MYRIFKEMGNNSVVTLINTETKGVLNLGTLSREMVRILNDDGYTFTDYKEKWDLPINKDITKTKLEKLAMKTHAPIRRTSEQIKKEANKNIDAMDVLLGLAQYK